MKSKEILTVAGLVTLSFSVTMGVLWVQRTPNVSSALRGHAALPRSWWAAPHGASPAAVSAAPARVPLPTSAAPVAEASVDVPPSDDSGPPLPVLLAISSHPARIADDADDADDGTGASARPGTVRQVDIFNNSDEALQITVLALDVPTQQTTQTLLFMLPHTQAHAGSESGLKLDPGNQVALRSRGYQEMTAAVR